LIMRYQPKKALSRSGATTSGIESLATTKYRVNCLCSVPTLVVGGRYDEATPVITETVHRCIPDSTWVIFENSSHMPHLEETEPFMETLTGFLDRVEKDTGRRC
jgi:pimeloyl-ACP methyl ester carboxylesterase